VLIDGRVAVGGGGGLVLVRLRHLFAELVELFDQFGVSFVSVTQSFNTTSSMGRLGARELLA
jgi:site-specific DNA recombinase